MPTLVITPGTIPSRSTRFAAEAHPGSPEQGSSPSRQAVTSSRGTTPKSARRSWEWAAAAGVLLAFVVALSWLSAAIGLFARSPESASAVTFFVWFLPTPAAPSFRS